MQEKPAARAAIVGAGIAGIAAAIRLAAKGYAVEVFESNAYPGGKLSEFTQGGYRFDAGPSLFTMPQWVDQLFELVGRNPRDYFTYRRLPVVCEYFYEDGTHLSAYQEPEKLAAEIEAKTGEPASRILQFLAASRTKYELTADVFLHRSLHRLSTYLTWAAVRGTLNLLQLDPFRTMHRANAATFTDPRVVQLFDRYATYNGSDPYQTPATLNVIPHLEYNVGAYFPEGGMYAIIQSLVRLAEEVGVRFHYSQPVKEIVLEKSRVTGLRLHQTPNNLQSFEVVVSNADVVSTYRRLLPGVKPPEKLLNQPKSSSALIFYWGIRQVFPQLGLHTIFFSQDYAAEFKSIWEGGSLHPDPTVYLNISSKEALGDAPPGCENWFVMVNVPNNTGQDWEQIIAQTRQNIIAKLNRLLQTDLAPLIAEEAILDPRTIERRTGSSQGALYGNSSNNRYAAFLRHANFSSKIKGLYFCGGSVHPGGGIPLCLQSAKIAADAVPLSG